MKSFFTNPVTIIVGIIASAGIISWWGYTHWGWFGGESSRQSCGCTSNRNCGRDQYCDGCNCTYEPNRITPIVPVIINPILPPPPPPPKPIPTA